MKNDVHIDHIPLDEISKAISTFDPTKTYLKGKYVDAHDQISWKVAYILNEQPSVIGIHYEGWGPRFDEPEIKKILYRLAPFRKNTLGYTGQVMQAYREFRYNKAEMQKYEKIIDSLIQNPLFILAPIEFTQEIRGNLFFYIDNLLTMLHIANPAQNDIKEILDFLKKTVKMIIEWMKFSWDLIPEFEFSEKYEQLYNLHGRTSICLVYEEFSIVLGGLFGSLKRSAQTFKLIYANLEDKAPKNDENIDLEKKAYEFMASYFYKEFKELGGFEEILKMIKDEKKLYFSNTKIKKEDIN